MTLAEGQKLWLVPNNGTYPREAVVSKVGRRWAEIAPYGRIDKTTLIIDGAGEPSPGRCYLSRAEHEEEAYVHRLWWKVRTDISNSIREPDGLTRADILAAAKLLGIDLSAVEKPE